MARTTNKRQAGSSNDRKHGSFGLQAELEELARCEKQHPSKKRGLFGTLGFDELKRYEEQHPSKKTGLFGTLGFDELKRYEEQQPSQKRRKTSAPSDALEELVCPITLELPMDPVMAEDGTIYERSAIEEHLKNSNKSPTKNTRMGKKLFASHQVKSTIEKLVRQASRSDSLAKTYNDRIKRPEMISSNEHAVEMCRQWKSLPPIYRLARRDSKRTRKKHIPGTKVPLAVAPFDPWQKLGSTSYVETKF